MISVQSAVTKINKKKNENEKKGIIKNCDCNLRRAYAVKSLFLSFLPCWVWSHLSITRELTSSVKNKQAANVQVIYASASLSWQYFYLFPTLYLSLSLSVATVSTALCAPVLFTLLTYLLNQIRLFFSTLPISLSPSLFVSLSLVYFMPLLHTYLFVQKTLWQFYQHAMHREKTRCTIWMQPSEMRVEPNRLKLFENRFCLHPNPFAHHHVLFIFFGLCFMVNLWWAYQCTRIQLQLLYPVSERVWGKW